MRIIVLIAIALIFMAAWSPWIVPYGLDFLSNDHLASSSLQHFTKTYWSQSRIFDIWVQRHSKIVSKDDDRISAVHNFFITPVKALHNWDVLSSNLVYEKSFFRPSTSRLDGPAHPSIVFSVAFVTLSTSVEANCSCYQSGVSMHYGYYLFSFHVWISSIFCWWLMLYWWSLDIFELFSAFLVIPASNYLFFLIWYVLWCWLRLMRKCRSQSPHLCKFSVRLHMTWHKQPTLDKSLM